LRQKKEEEKNNNIRFAIALLFLFKLIIITDLLKAFILFVISCMIGKKTSVTRRGGKGRENNTFRQ
jgi:uncharacterized membrane protein